MQPIDSRLWRIGVRLWPALAEMPLQQQIFSFTSVASTLYMLPTSLIAVVWLVFVTDLDLLTAHLPLWGVLLAVLIVISYFPFKLYIELANGELLQTTGDLSDVVYAGAALIFGPTALWIVTANQLIMSIRTGYQAYRSGTNGFWPGMGSLTQHLGRAVFGYLIALGAYRALGGHYPPADLSRDSWLLALAAIAISAAIEFTLTTLLVDRLNRLLSQVSELQDLTNWFRLLLALAIFVAPFPVLGALIYAAGNTALYLLFVAGVVLVNFLAYTLSQAVERSQQRARELAALEALGEAIIEAPPDLATLPDLLEAHVHRMFPQDRVEIKLFDQAEDDPNYHPHTGYHLHTASNRAPIDTALWDQLRASPDSYRLLPNFRLSGSGVKSTALLVKIGADDPGHEGGEKEVYLGGIALLRAQVVGRVQTSTPALQALASQIGSAFYRARVHRETLAAQKMSQELAFAGQIQAQFLPRDIPRRAGWDIAARLVPARQTSGDFYDFIDLPGDRLGLVVADVADKGTGAALFMALSRTLIRTFALEHPDSPESVLALANARILTDAESDQFVTVFYGVLDPAAGTLTYANAGHNPGFVVHHGNSAQLESLSKTGAPLGIMEDLTWERDAIALGGGDTLLLYTDGVSEAQDMDHGEFGEERLINAARAAARSTAGGNGASTLAHTIEIAITDAIHDFVGDAPQFDDITLVVVVRE